MSIVDSRIGLLRLDFVLFTTRPDPFTNQQKEIFGDLIDTYCQKCKGYREFIVGYKPDEVEDILDKLELEFKTEPDFPTARAELESKSYDGKPVSSDAVTIYAYNQVKLFNNNLLRENATVRVCRSCLARRWQDRYNKFHEIKMERYHELKDKEDGQKRNNSRW